MLLSPAPADAKKRVASEAYKRAVFDAVQTSNDPLRTRGLLAASNILEQASSGSTTTVVLSSDASARRLESDHALRYFSGGIRSFREARTIHWSLDGVRAVGDEI